jgi:uncharacterized membrane protein YsdA (DUF1294 family)
MSANNTVIIIQNQHSNATEFVIILSQSVFFVFLFLLMKSALIDRRGMMNSQERIMEEKLQIGAIFFAIFVFLGLLMIPMHSYEFVHYVVPITYIVIIGLIAWEINTVFKKKSQSPPVKLFNVPKKAPVVVSVDDTTTVDTGSSTPGTFLGSRSSKAAFDY